MSRQRQPRARAGSTAERAGTRIAAYFFNDICEDLKKRGVSLHLLDLGGDISGEWPHDERERCARIRSMAPR